MQWTTGTQHSGEGRSYKEVPATRAPRHIKGAAGKPHKPREIQEDPATELQTGPAKELQEDPVKELQEDHAEVLQEAPVRELPEDPVREPQENPATELQEGPGGGGAVRSWGARARAPVQQKRCRKGRGRSCRKVLEEEEH